MHGACSMWWLFCTPCDSCQHICPRLSPIWMRHSVSDDDAVYWFVIPKKSTKQCYCDSVSFKRPLASVREIVATLCKCSQKMEWANVSNVQRMMNDRSLVQCPYTYELCTNEMKRSTRFIYSFQLHQLHSH